MRGCCWCASGKTRLLVRGAIPERDERTRRQIATMEAAVVMMMMMMMMIEMVLTYGRSAWCGPLWDVWMELLCVLMVEIVVVGDGVLWMLSG